VYRTVDSTVCSCYHCSCDKKGTTTNNNNNYRIEVAIETAIEIILIEVYRN
jgi:hypothetical protein